MTDLSPTIAAKSDQLNSDDLIGGPRTITITKVSPGTSDQPINIHYEGDDGKPWRPCKSMRRVLVNMWGPKGDKYVGRSLTLFRDPSVKWGGIEVGGVRISHMSHIESETLIMLTETRGKKSEYRVRKLTQGESSAPPAKPPVEKMADAIRNAKDREHLARLVAKATGFDLTSDEVGQIEEARKSAVERIGDEPPTEAGDAWEG